MRSPIPTPRTDASAAAGAGQLALVDHLNCAAPEPRLPAAIGAQLLAHHGYAAT